MNSQSRKSRDKFQKIPGFSGIATPEHSYFEYRGSPIVIRNTHMIGHYIPTYTTYVESVIFTHERRYLCDCRNYANELITESKHKQRGVIKNNHYFSIS